MADQPSPHYNDLRAAARELTTAHAAIVAEIRRHAEREHSKRTAQHDAMEANRKLEPGGQGDTYRM